MSISALGNSGLPTAASINYPSQLGATTTPASAPASTATPIPGATPSASAANPSAETIKQAATTVEEFINSQANTQTQFSVDKSSALNVVKVFDTATNEEVAQYPSKDIVALAQAINKLQDLMSTTGVLHKSTA